MTIENIYQELLRDHYSFPRNRGEIAYYNISSGRVNPSCGDIVSIQGYVNSEGILRDIAFQGEGCMISQAAASLLTEYMKGKPLPAIQSLTAEHIKKILQIDLGPTRLRCALLTLEAVIQASAQIKSDSI